MREIIKGYSLEMNHLIKDNQKERIVIVSERELLLSTKNSPRSVGKST